MIRAIKTAGLVLLFLGVVRTAYKSVEVVRRVNAEVEALKKP